MTLSDITNKITFSTGADTNQFPNADRLISLNNYYNKVESIILSSQDEWDFDDTSITTNYPIATRNLVANQQDYSFATTSWTVQGKEGDSDTASQAITPLELERVEITYDGTNWYKAEAFDIGQSGLATDTTSISNNFFTTEPYYDVRSNSLWLYPIPTSAVTGGLKVWFHRPITVWTSSDLTTGTKVPGFDVLFHDYLSLGVAYDFAISRGKANAQQLKQELLEMEVRMKDFYGGKQQDRDLALGAAYVDYT